MPEGSIRMRDHSGHIQKTREEAWEIIRSHCRRIKETETVPLAEAVGRILAEDVFSEWDKPNCLTCALDSVAVRWEDFENGLPDTSSWKRGERWEFANTGVAMPDGFDTAVVVEHVTFLEDGERIRIEAAPSGKFAGTYPAGSRMKKGELLLAAGSRISPLTASHIAGGNHTEVRVLRRPKVAFLPTGNELVKAGGEIPKGKNIESNSVMIGAKIERWGGEPLLYDVVPDRREALAEALKRAAGEADLIVLNAGSSKGSDDWGIEVLEEQGEIFYHQINHGPGHHSAFGLFDGVPVIGISGPPGGAATTADLYLYPAVAGCLGQDVQIKKIRAELLEDMQEDPRMKRKGFGKSGEERPLEGGAFFSIRQMRLTYREDGMVCALPFEALHPGPVEAETADGYFFMPAGPDPEPPKKGEMIEIELRPEGS